MDKTLLIQVRTQNSEYAATVNQDMTILLIKQEYGTDSGLPQGVWIPVVNRSFNDWGTNIKLALGQTMLLRVLNDQTHDVDYYTTTPVMSLEVLNQEEF